MSDNNEIEILLAEDNQDDLDMTLYALAKAKIVNRLQVVRDGQEALDFIFCRGPYSARKIGTGPKVILLDLKLPKVDGLEVLRTVRGDPRTQYIPVVMLTSSREQSDVVASYKLGVNSYIVKPVNFEQFAEAVQKLGLYWLLLNENPKI